MKRKHLGKKNKTKAGRRPAYMDTPTHPKLSNTPWIFPPPLFSLPLNFFTQKPGISSSPQRTHKSQLCFFIPNQLWAVPALIYIFMMGVALGQCQLIAECEGPPRFLKLDPIQIYVSLSPVHLAAAAYKLVKCQTVLAASASIPARLGSSFSVSLHIEPINCK